jgi:hypothetical protein
MAGIITTATTRDMDTLTDFLALVFSRVGGIFIDGSGNILLSNRFKLNNIATASRPEMDDFVAKMGLLRLDRSTNTFGAAGFDPPALTRCEPP